MGNFLSIIIPRYKETELEVFPLLSSINGQLGVDFSEIEIIIANDGGGTGELDKDFLSLFTPQIRQVSLKENKGPGVARQAGLDVANGQYVMFCDADDTLHNVGALGVLLEEAEKNVPDMISSNFLEEVTGQDGKFKYVTHECDNTWMHGKLLRRQFLIQHNIRFHEDIRIQEDGYFLGIVAGVTRHRIHLPAITYVWKYNQKSITRHDHHIYSYTGVPDFIRATVLSGAEIFKRNPDREMMKCRIIQLTCNIFFTVHHSDWLEDEHKQHVIDVEKAFIKYMKPEWEYWENASKEDIEKIYNDERAKSFSRDIERENIFDWIGRLGLSAK